MKLVIDEAGQLCDTENVYIRKRYEKQPGGNDEADQDPEGP